MFIENEIQYVAYIVWLNNKNISNALFIQEHIRQRKSDGKFTKGKKEFEGINIRHNLTLSERKMIKFDMRKQGLKMTKR